MRLLVVNKVIFNQKSNNTAKNNLKRDFNGSRPNEKWVTDVTEFKYGK